MKKISSEEKQLIETCRDKAQEYYNSIDNSTNRRKTISKWEKALIKLNEIKEYLERKLFALIVISLAASTLYYSNFVRILLHHTNVLTMPLVLSIIGFVIFFGFVIYLSAYLPGLGLNDDQIDKVQDKLTPYMTLLSIFSTMLLIYAVWDVYYYYSIFLVLILEFGLVMTFRFSPSGILGNILFYLILIAMIMSGHYIDHEGYFHN